MSHSKRTANFDLKQKKKYSKTTKILNQSELSGQLVKSALTSCEMYKKVNLRHWRLFMDNEI